jgi:dihydroorotase-like cyclic amidohydrolase
MRTIDHATLFKSLPIAQGWSPFEDWNLTGHPVTTIMLVQVVFDTEVRGEALSFG